MRGDRKLRWILAGWILFIVSAAFFIAASLRSGDMLSLAGGVFFLIACLAFLVPFLRDYRNRD